MALTSENLLAISQLLGTKLRPLKDRTRTTELLLENDTLPRLQNIEVSYTSTYSRYANGIKQFEAVEIGIGPYKNLTINI